MSETPSPELAVQRYLDWLDDPSSIIDQQAIEKAENVYRNASNSLDRLHAAAAVERAKTADVDKVEADFVAYARAYADANGLPVEAFRTLKVSDDILARAGFSVSSGRRANSRGRRSAQRVPSIGVEAIKAAVSQLPKQFTLAQLAEKAGGGSPATVKKAVDQLVAAGLAVRLGPKPDHSGPGRAPTLYEQR